MYVNLRSAASIDGSSARRNALELLVDLESVKRIGHGARLTVGMLIK
jgi:hypothetical protein